MTTLFGIAVIGAAGTAGWFAFAKLRLPLPALLGSLFATGVLAVLGFFPNFSDFPGFPAASPLDYISFLCKVAIGVMMGRRINRGSVRLMRSLAIPASLICIWMLAASIASGYLLYLLSPLPLSTALVGCAAGGVTEMAIFALSQNYDVATTTFIQVFRLVAVLAITPYVVKKWSERIAAREGTYPMPADETGEARVDLAESRLFSFNETALLVPIAMCAGFALDRLAVPAGAMLGSLVATAAMGLARDKVAPFHGWVRTAAQIGLGAAIANRIDPGTFGSIVGVLPAIIASSLALVASSLVLAFVLHRITRWDAATCMLSTSAGGLTQMIMIAEEMDADPLRIGVLHLARYLAIIGGMPFIISCLM